ncbi:MAG: hypothetical protein C4532_09180 [Candidatus Abyssobacteria bacterium SURF_17]|uniref:Uncharacterized protein n=1 Tax=Candidatus Abyssobacteria bacterium SURF_17 TaxID=2093361 RepID=A0A419EZ38_9BACT|nr:MAG: hypothetical protein C4532_09180 [Candidatus Abyssubacteria bacterium SURF_17]
MSDSSNTEDNPDASAIRDFLRAPHGRRQFEAFFDLCRRETHTYLRHLSARGWQMPAGFDNSPDSYRDLAIDVLGPFLASRPGRPYYVVFDYFARHGITDFDKEPADNLVRHFRILLRGFARKEFTALKDIGNPQVAALKQRIRKVLLSPAYSIREDDCNHSKIVRSLESAGDIREGRPWIPRDQLLQMVYQAYLDTVNREDWCRHVFKFLDEHTEFRNELSVYALVSAMVCVNTAWVDASLPREPVSPAVCHEQAGQVIDSAMAMIEREIIPGFIRKGKLAESDVQDILTASRDYLEDLCFSGATDSIPTYFLELRTDISQDEYQKRFKYIMDTVVARATVILRRDFGKGSTKGSTI